MLLSFVGVICSLTSKWAFYVLYCLSNHLYGIEDIYAQII